MKIKQNPEIQEEIERIRDKIIHKYFPTLNPFTMKDVRDMMNEYVSMLGSEIIELEIENKDLKNENQSLSGGEATGL